MKHYPKRVYMILRGNILSNFPSGRFINDMLYLYQKTGEKKTQLHGVHTI